MDVREKLVELLDRFVYDEWYGNDDIADKLISNGVTVQEWIDKAPTFDAVPVVRCKDCKHWHKDTVFCGYMPYGEATERVNWYADDFCSYGERKGE